VKRGAPDPQKPSDAPHDYKVDLRERPQRPLPSGRIRRRGLVDGGIDVLERILLAPDLDHAVVSVQPLGPRLQTWVLGAAAPTPAVPPGVSFSSSGVGLTETLLKFSHQQNLRIAVEYVDRDSLDQPIAVTLQRKTVRQGLDAILRNGPGYSWRLQNGIIEITNKHGSKRADKQLNTVIPVFETSATESAKMASTMLWWNLQMKFDPSVKGFAGSILEGEETSKVKPATLHNRTAREILAYIVPSTHASAHRKEIHRLKQLLAEKTLEVDFFRGALQKIEARRQRSSDSGEMASTTRSEK
jgi:hypothetical protein